MSRAVYVVTGRWPSHQLSQKGLATDLVLCGEAGHVGLYFHGCSEEEVRAHSKVSVSEADGRGERNVCFDFQLDKFPRFQRAGNNDYWTTEAEIFTYLIKNVSFAALHDACVQCALLRPYNSNLFRISPLLGGVLPCAFASTGTPRVAPSTCVALTLRLIAQAKTGDAAMLVDDRAVFDALGLRTETRGPRCGATRLIGFKPHEAIEALQRADVIGKRRHRFEGRAPPVQLLLLRS